MDYFDYMRAHAQRSVGLKVVGDVVEFDRNVDDTARILRDTRGEAVGFEVRSADIRCQLAACNPCTCGRFTK